MIVLFVDWNFDVSWSGYLPATSVWDINLSGA